MSNPYLRTIFGAAREHGVSHEQLHDIIALEFGKASLRDLTKEQSLQLLNGIRGEEQSRSRRRHAQAKHGRRGHKVLAHQLVNARELKLLREAASVRGWDSVTLTAFVLRQVGRAEVVTMADFNKVFWALKSMNRREGLYS